jgi:protein-ribulosamine 3-kinase
MLSKTRVGSNVPQYQSLVSALFTNGARGLPKDSSLISTEGGAASYWSQTARIHVQLSDGKERTYFLKLTRGSIGKLMAEGEFESMKALHAIAPHMVPEPIGYGTFSTNSDTHFILIEFLNLHDGLPSEEKFCRQLAELHRKSMEHSPNGKFGFHLTTCNGTVQQDTTWTDSWETFYTRLLKQAFAFDEDAHGPCSDYSELLPLIYDKVCPRLLRPLETEGRTIRPALIHGDLWDGNVALQAHTEQTYIFDSSAFYAHNEYDLHMWRGERFKIRDSYITEYFKHLPPSEPAEEWEDRNRLYSLQADLHDSILFKGRTDKFRKLLVQTMQELVEKYANGYEGTAKCKGN